MNYQPPPQQQQMVNQPPSSSTSPTSSSGLTVGSGSQQNNSMNNQSPAPSKEEDMKVRDKCLYLKQLLQDKKQIQGLTGCFLHVDRILDEEIVKVRSVLFQNGDKQPLELPTPQGPTVTLTEKVYVPVKDHPEYNFVGRLLGPRGLTAKQLEQETRCKIMVRGKGSMRDKKKEDSNRGKPNWEHLSDDLHVLITVEDTENRARIKMKRAIEEINKLLVPTEGEDELKKKQLMELAIINGTYRDYSAPSSQPRLVAPPPAVIQNAAAIRPQTPGQPQLGVNILSRLPNGQVCFQRPNNQHVITNGLPHPPPMLTTPGDGSLLYYTPYDFTHSQAIASTQLDYNMFDPAQLLGKSHLHM